MDSNDTGWRDLSMRLCDALGRILREDSSKTEQARLVDRISAARLIHEARTRIDQQGENACIATASPMPTPNTTEQ
jgi:hypothetical protein